MDNEKFLSPENILTPNEKEQIDMQFGGGVKLSADYINAYVMIDFCKQLKKFERMEPVQTYKEYFGKNPNQLLYVLKLSDPKAIEDLDKLVSDFNSDLDRIKKDTDMEAVKDFLNKIGDLMKEKK